MDDSDFAIESLAHELGMSRMQLHRKLSAVTNTSASGFIRHIRLQRAAEMIATGRENISEVAFAVGFSNLSYFSEIFKSEFGVAPSKYNQEKVTS